MNLKEEKVNSSLIYDGRIIKLYNDEIKLPDGNGAYREYVKHPGGVCVVPITDKGEVMLVRQYRYVYGKEIIEIPAGKRDGADEDTLVGAKYICSYLVFYALYFLLLILCLHLLQSQ